MFEARKKCHFHTTLNSRQTLRSQAWSGLTPSHLWRSSCSCPVYPHPERKNTMEHWDRVSPSSYASAGIEDRVLDLRLPDSERQSQLPLSSSKSGHIPTLPGGGPARNPLGSSAALEDIWSPRQCAKIRKRWGRGEGMRCEWRSG